MKYFDMIIIIMLGFASISDLFYKKVSNIWLAIWLVVGIYIRSYDFIVLFLLALLCTYILYYLAFFGAADIKIISILCGYLGIKKTLYLSFIALCLAAIYSLYYLIRKKILIERLEYFFRYCDISFKAGRFFKYTNSFSDSINIAMIPFFLVAFILMKVCSIWI